MIYKSCKIIKLFGYEVPIF